MLKNDLWISQQASLGMLEPFQEKLIRHLEPELKKSPVLSFGCSSYGYDLRLSSKEFLIFKHVPGTVMNPKKFNPANLEPTDLKEDEDGKYFILPAHSYGLGVALEKMKVPPNITVICLGKSPYARVGRIVNTTPAEAGWEGHLTLEISNSSVAKEYNTNDQFLKIVKNITSKGFIRSNYEEKLVDLSDVRINLKSKS